MSERRVAPYGTWSSPISAELVATAGISLGQVAFDRGLVYWNELHPTEDARTTLCRADAFSSAAEVLPAPFSIRTKVHEYGGGAWTVHAGTVFFSNWTDQRLYRYAPGGEDPVAITPETGGTHRYADGRITPDGAWWIGVRERHDGPHVPADVHNELVAIATDGSGEPRTIASGRDFYATPRLSHDGARLAWLAWDLPWMPWDGCELFVAELAEDATLGAPRPVAGRDGEESIWQPAWSPAGELHWASDRTGWWNLERERAGARQAICPREAEFGWPQWVFGGSSYAFLADGRIVCHYGSHGVQHTALLDPDTGELVDLDLPHTAISYPSLVAEGSQIAFLAGGPSIPKQVVLLDFQSRAVEVLRESEHVEAEEAYFSTPTQIEFPTDGDRTAFAHVYAPRNPDVQAPDGERPPLIVMSHGGPTSEAVPSFDLEVQFWTSRGFAVVDVNYGGSTGFGRPYRQRLNGNWGVVDMQDCIRAARFLAEQGEVDGARLLIRGGSAGGYTTLCALVFTDDFAAGASYYGIADLVPFAAGGTHKFESSYEHTLVGPWPQAEELYRARSPINFVDMLSTPMLLLQGAEDAVVPPAQAELMVSALRAKGLPYAYLLFEGEQHGFRKAESNIRALQAELSFYAQILGIEPAGSIPRLPIENLGS
ncbi:MAG: S9 family peptidase [Actinomycetota bacterium]